MTVCENKKDSVLNPIVALKGIVTRWRKEKHIINCGHCNHVMIVERLSDQEVQLAYNELKRMQECVMVREMMEVKTDGNKVDKC